MCLSCSLCVSLYIYISFSFSVSFPFFLSLFISLSLQHGPGLAFYPREDLLFKLHPPDSSRGGLFNSGDVLFLPWKHVHRGPASPVASFKLFTSFQTRKEKPGYDGGQMKAFHFCCAAGTSVEYIIRCVKVSFFFLTYSFSYIYFYLQDYKKVKEKPWKSLEPGISNAWTKMEKASTRNLKNAVLEFKRVCKEVSCLFFILFFVAFTNTLSTYRLPEKKRRGREKKQRGRQRHLWQRHLW